MKVSTLSSLLGSLQQGELDADASNQLREIVAALHGAHGKPKAKMTITLDFELDSGVINISGDYAVKLPRRARGRTIFWATPENNLSRQDPRQAEMAFRDVSLPAARTVS